MTTRWPWPRRPGPNKAGTQQERQQRARRDSGAGGQLLEQARQGKIDEAGAFPIRSRLVNQLAALEQQLAELEEAVDAENLRDLRQDFQDYRMPSSRPPTRP